MSSSYNTMMRITVITTQRTKYCMVKDSKEAKVRVDLIIETFSSRETRISNNKEISSSRETFKRNDILTQTNNINGPERE